MANKQDVANHNKLVDIAVKQLETSRKFTQKRMEDIQKSEDLYYGKTRPALLGRFNVPLPIMSGFVDTLMAKIDDPPYLRFNPTDEADTIKAKKVNSAWEIDSSSTRGKWGMKDRGMKKLACFSGRGSAIYWAESGPEYKSNIEVVDHLDLHSQPMGGQDLEKHLFAGREMVFLTVPELEAGAASGLYDATQVAK